MSLASLTTFLDALPPQTDPGPFAPRPIGRADQGTQRPNQLFRTNLRDTLDRRGEPATGRRAPEQEAAKPNRSTDRDLRRGDEPIGRSDSRTRSSDSRAAGSRGTSEPRSTSARASDAGRDADGSQANGRALDERRNRPVDENERGFPADADGHANPVDESDRADVEETSITPRASDQPSEQSAPPTGLFDSVDGRRQFQDADPKLESHSDAESIDEENSPPRSFIDAVANAGGASQPPTEAPPQRVSSQNVPAAEFPGADSEASRNRPDSSPATNSSAGMRNDRREPSARQDGAADPTADGIELPNATNGATGAMDLADVPVDGAPREPRAQPPEKAESENGRRDSEGGEATSAVESMPSAAGTAGAPRDSSDGFGHESPAAVGHGGTRPDGQTRAETPANSDGAIVSRAAEPPASAETRGTGAAAPAALPAGTDEGVETSRSSGNSTPAGSGSARSADLARGDASPRMNALSGTQPRVDAGEFANRLAAAVNASRDAGQQLRIRLNPPELGSLRVEVAARDGALFARLDVETQAAQRAVLDNLGQLRELLAQHGTAIERIDVNVEPRHGDGRPQDFTGGFEGDRPDGEGREQPPEQPYWERSEMDDALGAPSPARGDAGRLDRLDIRV